MNYKYETHVHTAETSKCGASSGADFARFFKRLGYTGIFVTDHFLGGNTTVPDEVPWAQRIAWFCRGYEAAAQAGARLGLDVFFAWEYGFGWSHFLTYGLDRKWLLANPDLLSWDLPGYCDRVHAAGGAIVQAHPFREGIDLVHLVPGKTDAVEIINANRPADANRHAADFAASFNLPGTAGSDIHAVRQKRLCSVVCQRKLARPGDYLAALQAGAFTLGDETRA